MYIDDLLIVFFPLDSHSFIEENFEKKQHNIPRQATLLEDCLNKNQLTAPVEKGRQAGRCESWAAATTLVAGMSH